MKRWPEPILLVAMYGVGLMVAALTNAGHRHWRDALTVVAIFSSTSFLKHRINRRVREGREL